MSNEQKIADVLSRLQCLRDDLIEANTREQAVGWMADASIAMGKAFELINEQLVEIHRAKAERDEFEAKCVALGRYVSIGRRQKSQYFRAVKWFLANTNIRPADVPTPVYHTLVHVVNTLAEKAKRAVSEDRGAV